MPPPGGLVEFTILLSFLHQLLDRIFLTGNLAGFIHAPVGTDTAAGTFGTIEDQLAIHNLVRTVRTFLYACAAGGTTVMEDHKFLVKTLTLRIVTPLAGKWTSLKEDCGPDSGSVMDGKISEY